MCIYIYIYIYGTCVCVYIYTYIYRYIHTLRYTLAFCDTESNWIPQNIDDMGKLLYSTYLNVLSDASWKSIGQSLGSVKSALRSEVMLWLRTKQGLGHPSQMGVSIDWGIQIGCFISWKILLNWMIWGYPYFRKPPDRH